MIPEAPPRKHKGDLSHIEAGLALVTNWSVAVDGGGHIGMMTDILRQRFATVHVYEPGAIPLPDLRRKVADWPNVILHEQALGAAHDMVWFGHDGRRESSRSWFADPTQQGSTEMVPLDALGLERCGMIKLDLEGGELAAITGAAATIRRCRPVLIVETAPITFARSADPDGKRLFGTIAALGYRIARRLWADTVFVHEERKE